MNRRSFLYGITAITGIAYSDNTYAFWFLLRLGARGAVRGGRIGATGRLGPGARLGVMPRSMLRQLFNEAVSPVARAQGITTWEYVSGNNPLGLHLSTRHFYGNMTIPKTAGNSIYVGGRCESVVADFDRIILGRAVKRGQDFHVNQSGRVWRMVSEDGSAKLFPVRGPDIINLSNLEYNLIARVQTEGVEAVTTEMEFRRSNGAITDEQYITVKSLMAIFAE